MNANASTLAGIAILFLSAAPTMAQDAARGEELFEVCTACHSLAPDENGIGPSLAGIVGRDAADIGGFDYSGAMKDSGLTWDEETLALFIANSAGIVPDTSMDFPGVGDDQDALDIAAFLADQ